MNWQSAVERTVTGLGYDLVDAEKSAGGLLRVYIDHVPEEGGHVGAPGKFIGVDDCEKVTRQLQHVLEVDDVAYERLEVSSPGLDRPLKKPSDYARFAGEQVELTLKLPFEGRKKFRGELLARGDGWRLALSDTGKSRVTKGKPVKTPADAAPGGLALDFSLDEVREARLVPVVDFKGRRFASQADVLAPGSAPAEAAGPDDEVDGGRIQ